MVKGNLIENKSYYGNRKNLMVLSFSSAGLLGIMLNLHRTPIWLSVLVVLGFIAMQVYTYKNQRRITELTTKKIEIDTDKILIKSESGSVLESINLNELDRIVIKEEYKIQPEAPINAYNDELSGKPNMNFIEIVKGDDHKRIDFELDTHYMFVQLSKTIDTWKQNDLNVELINS